jgi:hypothetical protein
MNYIYLFLVLLIVKLAGWLKISWWIVTLPLWIWPALIALIFTIIIILPLVGMVIFIVGTWIALGVIGIYEWTKNYLQKKV